MLKRSSLSMESKCQLRSSWELMDKTILDLDESILMAREYYFFTILGMHEYEDFPILERERLGAIIDIRKTKKENFDNLLRLVKDWVDIALDDISVSDSSLDQIHRLTIGVAIRALRLFDMQVRTGIIIEESFVTPDPFSKYYIHFE